MEKEEKLKSQQNLEKLHKGEEFTLAIKKFRLLKEKEKALNF